jgi:hypothetical protein
MTEAAEKAEELAKAEKEKMADASNNGNDGQSLQ